MDEFHFVREFLRQAATPQEFLVLLGTIKDEARWLVYEREAELLLVVRDVLGEVLNKNTATWMPKAKQEAVVLTERERDLREENRYQELAADRLLLQPGDRVLVRHDDDSLHEHVITSPPWPLGHGCLVVGLSGIAGGYQLSRVVQVLSKKDGE